METLVYAIIFIIGCFFGSFFSLAVYRIPRNEDILIKHSYCPNCNHKLGFLDLFPVFSYIFLRGRCRYCKNKIRPRYLILEVFSGITFLLYAISLKINIYTIDLVYLVFSYLYISTIFILSGIDKEYHSINKKVLIFGFCIEFIYMIYKCVLTDISIYRYVMYMVLFAVLILFSAIITKKHKNNKYIIEILFLCLYIIVFWGSIIYILSVIMFFLCIALLGIVRKKSEQIPIGFLLCISNIIVIIIANFIFNYLM